MEDETLNSIDLNQIEKLLNETETSRIKEKYSGLLLKIIFV